MFQTNKTDRLHLNQNIWKVRKIPKMNSKQNRRKLLKSYAKLTIAIYARPGAYQKLVKHVVNFVDLSIAN